MKVAPIGASGNVGSRILAQLLSSRPGNNLPVLARREATLPARAQAV
jgi:putative NADH-flavin reductase